MTAERFPLILAWALTDVVLCGEYCFHYRDGLDYCENGCCGRTLQEYCCMLATWAIVLLVVGALVLAGGALFVCLFYYCKKRGRTNGRVVFPAQQSTTVATVHTVQYPAYPIPSAPLIQPPPYTPGTYYNGGSNPQPGQQQPSQQPPSSGQNANNPTNPYGPAVYDANQYSAGNQSSIHPARGLDPAYPPPNLYSS